MIVSLHERKTIPGTHALILVTTEDMHHLRLGLTAAIDAETLAALGLPLVSLGMKLIKGTDEQAVAAIQRSQRADVPVFHSRPVSLPRTRFGG